LAGIRSPGGSASGGVAIYVDNYRIRVSQLHNCRSRSYNNLVNRIRVFETEELRPGPGLARIGGPHFGHERRLSDSEEYRWI